MLAFFFLLFFAAIAAITQPWSHTPAAQAQAFRQARMEAVALTMAASHSAAMRACPTPTSCAAGPVPVVVGLPGGAVRYPVTSVSDGEGHVVTVADTSSAPDRTVADTGILVALLARSQNYRGAGRWSAAAGGVNTSTYVYEGRLYNPVAPVSQEVGGLTLYDGQPIIAEW